MSRMVLAHALGFTLSSALLVQAAAWGLLMGPALCFESQRQEPKNVVFTSGSEDGTSVSKELADEEEYCADLCRFVPTKLHVHGSV